jgi:predicted deacetylase
MSDWLDPLRRELDADRRVTFFFRDDDAGWRDDLLLRLLDVFDGAGAPVDLAVIPAALGRPLARELSRRGASTGLHQHGFAHVSHEREGRKCEFGRARDEAAQRADIERGRQRLEALLEAELDPSFTPPWNRCTHSTGRALLATGFRVLSRESRAEPLGLDELEELSVDVDWFAKGLSREELGERLAACARRSAVVGVMLHHAVSDADDLRELGRLLELLANEAGVRLTRMTELVGDGAAA